MVHGNGQTCHLLLITTENNLEVKTKTLLITANFIVCSFNEFFNTRTYSEIAFYFITNDYIMSKLDMPEIKRQNFI